MRHRMAPIGWRDRVARPRRRDVEIEGGNGGAAHSGGGFERTGACGFDLRIQRGGMTRHLPLARRETEAAEASVRALRVVLIGPIQQENLALQYLAASARRAG